MTNIYKIIDNKYIKNLKLFLLIIILLFSLNIAFANHGIGGGQGSDDHAGWKDMPYDSSDYPYTIEYKTSGTNEWYTLISDLDNYCKTWVDRAFAKDSWEAGCNDNEYSVSVNQPIECKIESNALKCKANGLTFNSMNEPMSYAATLKGYPSQLTWVNFEYYSKRYDSTDIFIKSISDQKIPSGGNIAIDVNRGTTYEFNVDLFKDIFNDPNGVNTFGGIRITSHNAEYSDAGDLYYGNSIGDLYYGNSIYETGRGTEFSVLDIPSFSFIPRIEESIYDEIFRFKVVDTSLLESESDYSFKARIIKSPISLIFNLIEDSTSCSQGVCNLDEDFSKGIDAYRIDLASKCEFGDGFSILSNSNPDLLEATIMGNDLILESNDDAYGETEIVIECREDTSLPVSTTLNVIVNPIYDGVNFNLAFLQKPEEQRYTEFGLSERDSIVKVLPIINPDNSELQISSQTNPPLKGTVNFFERDGLYFVNYTSLNQRIGLDQFSYEVTDGAESLIGTIVATINNVNDAPSTLPNSITIREDTNYTFNPLTSFPYSDPERTLMSYVVIESLPQKGKLFRGDSTVGFYEEIPYESISELKYVPDKDLYGENVARFFFSVSDGVLESSPSIFTINIDPQNDAPIAETIETQTIYEDSKDNLFNLYLDDPDGDDLTIEFNSLDQLIIKNSNIIDLSEAGYTRVIEVIPEPNVANKNVGINARIKDGKGGIITEYFEVNVIQENDIPISENFTKSEYIYSEFNIGLNEFKFADIDFPDTAYSTFTELEILSIPDVGSGTLSYNGENLLTSKKITNLNPETFDLVYRAGINPSNSTILFRVNDGNEYSKVYNFTIKILPSPFGPNSQPSSLGGVLIPTADQRWSCKPGYQPVETSITLGYTCELVPNIPPVANFTIYPLFDGEAKKDVDLYFRSTSEDPDYGDLTYNWSFNENGTTPMIIGKFNGTAFGKNICTSGTCSVTLTVSDGEDSDSITKTFNYTGSGASNQDLDEIKETEQTNNLLSSNQIILEEGSTYTNNQLSVLGLKAGETVVRGSQKITVDSNGKVTKLENLMAQTSDGNNENVPSYKVGDGYCTKGLGENSVNSPSDCKKSSGLGILLVISFISILGILGFVAWKKGLFSKLSKSNQNLASPTSYDVPTYEPSNNQTQSFNQNSNTSTGLNLGSLVKEKINEGYSEGEIKSYLISKGYSESEIDNAFNS